MNRYDRIQSALLTQLKPEHLEVLDESHQHNVPLGTESHFKIIVVSAQFESTSMMNRRRRVQDLLTTEFNTGLHALSIEPLTPVEWQAKGGVSTLETPLCAHKKAPTQ